MCVWEYKLKHRSDHIISYVIFIHVAMSALSLHIITVILDLAAIPGADGADVGGARRVALKGLLFLPFFWTAILFT